MVTQLCAQGSLTQNVHKLCGLIIYVQGRMKPPVRADCHEDNMYCSIFIVITFLSY